ncbi:MAG: signal peptide peptidase SppA [Verrucomicrobiota bacterium]
MKSFFASLLGTVAGIAICCGLILSLAFGGLMLMALADEQTVDVEPGSWLVLDLTGLNITDTPPPEDQLGMGHLFGGDGPEPISLRNLTRALRAAADDRRIAGVFITGELFPEGYGTGLAALDEVRVALAEFKAGGKPVRAFFEQPGMAELYLAAGATELTVDPFGLVVLPGMSVEPMFYAGAFERFGIGVQVTRSGKYKSAVEPFIRRDLSPENREQLQTLVDGLWGMVTAGIAQDRGLTLTRLQQLVDRQGLIQPDAAREAGLISRVAYRDEIFAELLDQTGREATEGFTQVDIRDYVKAELAPNPAAAFTPGRIAVIYAEGAIVDGEGYEGEVGGASFSRELRLLRQDDDIAAIVLRVNSPGGSASASEQILRELQLAREAKPVVVSMGTYAASGGYWICTQADKVYAEPTTITGSIGVFGMQLNVQKLANDLGLTWDGVKTGELAGVFSVARPKTDTELAIFQNMVDRTYAEFLQRVASARGLTLEEVHDMAQGRVWSGVEARSLKLVDDIGGLHDAIQDAAARAGISADEVVVQEFPGPLTLGEMLQALFADLHPQQVRSGPLAFITREMTAGARVLRQFNDPRGVYARLPLEISSR